MKKTTLILAFCLGAAAPLLADGTNMLADEKARDSYAIGMSVGRNLAHSLQAQNVETDPDLIVRAFKDVLTSNATLLTPEQEQQTLTALQMEIRARLQAKQAELAAKDKSESDAFLAKNKTQPGVVTLPDGLQYKVITEGDGEIPGNNDVVKVNFRGTLLDGAEFGAGNQSEIAVGRVFRGWSEALKRMKVGSKWQLFIPPDLACGQNGMPPRIPPNAALIMDVELVAIQPSNPPPAAAGQPLTSDIIKVPSAEAMKKGAKIEILKPEDVQRLQQSQPQPTN
jgi:FKBP-type peptidyl-prolyl cis-trans isomerase FklB